MGSSRLHHENLTANVSISFFLPELESWCNIQSVYSEKPQCKSVLLDRTIWKMLLNRNKKQLLHCCSASLEQV